MAVDDASQDGEDLWLVNKDASRKLEDEYLLGDIVGRSSFSTVHKCLRKGRTEWTCKILEKCWLDRDLVKSQMPKLMKLKHRNITRIKEVFEDERTLQLIVESVTGGDIFEKIVERGQYSEQEAAQAVQDILQALQYLHGHGVVHGDIRPENMLYESDMSDVHLKVTDFGLSQLSDKNVMINNMSGLSRFCAPEVILGADPDMSSDLWSLGVVIYTMLCGREPFWSENGDVNTYDNIIEGNYNFSSPLWDGISESAKELISSLLSVDSAKRPTADAALRHPWTLGIGLSSIPRDNMIKGLIEYTARRRFRVATKAVLATQRALHIVRQLANATDTSTHPEESKKSFILKGMEGDIELRPPESNTRGGRESQSTTVATR